MLSSSVIYYHLSSTFQYHHVTWWYDVIWYIMYVCMCNVCIYIIYICVYMYIYIYLCSFFHVHSAKGIMSGPGLVPWLRGLCCWHLDMSIWDWTSKPRRWGPPSCLAKGNPTESKGLLRSIIWSALGMYMYIYIIYIYISNKYIYIYMHMHTRD